MRSLAKMVFALVALTTSVQADITALMFHAGNSVEYNAIKSELEVLGEQYPIGDVDTTAESAVALVSQYDVRRLPMMVFLEDGVEIDRIAGVDDQWSRRVTDRLSGEPSWRGYRSVVRIAITSGPGAKTPKAPKTSGNNTGLPDEMLQPSASGVGSGVIIRSRPGFTLIATARHVASAEGEAQGNTLTAQLFRDGVHELFPVKFVYEAPGEYADVSLVALVGNPRTFTTALPGGLVPEVSAGDPLYSYGCSKGAEPTFQIHQALGMSANGAALIVRGFPQRGRSGGPLFNREFRLVGICSAQSIEHNIGIYIRRNALYKMIREYDASQSEDEEPNP